MSFPQCKDAPDLLVATIISCQDEPSVTRLIVGRVDKCSLAISLLAHFIAIFLLAPLQFLGDIVHLIKKMDFPIGCERRNLC